jgi:pimeloyl-ACP methyl ester carboxylesterase
MASPKATSNLSAPTQFVEVGDNRYAYRRFGSAAKYPLLFLQHFTGTLDNWDPAVTDPLAKEREVILFDSAGVGRSSGKVPDTVADMAAYGLSFLDALDLKVCDVLGYSLGGMIAQMALNRSSIFRKMVLVATAPRGGEDIMNLEKPTLAPHLNNPKLKGFEVLQRSFLRRRKRARRPVRRSSRDLSNALRIGIPCLDRRSLRLKWRPSESGRNIPASGLRT